MQGNIVKIIDQSGTVAADYTYDSWGKITAESGNSEVRELNPFRYRGYVYDVETGLYYLQSRYYDPVTGRFINADIYCDTQSNILGTNMFAYCNNNPTNQVDPQGTDAYWVQFGDAVGGHGHTSLLLQDTLNNWWYFYWGPKHVILRPCGKDDFPNYNALTSYLCGFDPRPNHNYYVYATNVVDDREDVHYSAGEKYYLKCHDRSVTNWIYFRGDFSTAFNYAYRLIMKTYSWSNANQLYEKAYENGKPITIYHVCEKIYYPYVGESIDTGYYLSELKSSNEAIIRSYDFFSYNCVQVSAEVLLEGSFSGEYHKYYSKLREIYSGFAILRGRIPNDVYDELKSI